jgi:inosine-uridine nucleoside N-ribohydrolase
VAVAPTAIPGRIPVIVDCDPGHDDVLAIVVAAHHTELVGVTTVAGNAPIERTTQNALVARELVGGTFPVHRGAARPLVAEPKHAAYVHGESGLDGAALPTPSRPLDGDDAVGYLIETCREREGVWLVATGPLTNLALALRSAPDLAHRVAGISVMGGGLFGNRSAVGEFNIWADPEAAAIVLGYGGPLVLAGLHVTHQFLATPERIARVRALNGATALVLADLLDFFSATYVERHEDMDGAAVHDPLAVLALTHPALFSRRWCHVVVETTGEHTRGMTVIDVRTLHDRPASNCEVLMTIDAEAAFDVMIDAIAACAASGVR